ncbi:hypothetical protein F5B19DRAFT_496109 [Rostrohypoxylon terebratum]|nr:hypothetical protein F5B19DRAFT_496109 [Rostrohypoxylon terebratum]
MPSRRGLPTLSIFSRHSAPPTTSPPQPSPVRSPVPPVTPPARLHLRNLLPTSPEGMPTPPLPPRQPYAWLWQCHSCSTVYRIGCTRRCLVCSHEYCVSASPPKAVRGKKRRRASGMCASEFDYSGWADWGAWRRKVLGLEVGGRAGERQREQAFCDRTHNCIVDCDYPSECHHERYRLHTEALERRMLEESARLDEPQSPSINRRRRLSTDDKIPSNEEREIEEERKEDVEEKKSPTSPRSPLSQTSFFWDEPESRDGDEKAWWVDSERSEKKKRKTKSQQKIEQLTGLGVIPEETSEAMDPEMLQNLIEEDRDMMPLEVADESLGRRCKNRFSFRERLGHRRKSSVRSLATVEEWEEWEDSSDSESDDNSVLSSLSSCSNTITAASEASSEGSHDETNESQEERDEELDMLVKARKSFLRD